MLGPIFMGVSHTWRLSFMYWDQQTADYYAGHCKNGSFNQSKMKYQAFECDESEYHYFAWNEEKWAYTQSKRGEEGNCYREDWRRVQVAKL